MARPFFQEEKKTGPRERSASGKRNRTLRKNSFLRKYHTPRPRIAPLFSVLRFPRAHIRPRNHYNNKAKRRKFQPAVEVVPGSDERCLSLPISDIAKAADLDVIFGCFGFGNGLGGGQTRIAQVNSACATDNFQVYTKIIPKFPPPGQPGKVSRNCF